MCEQPGRLPDGTEIACRECTRCRDNRVNDWVGRCIAESKTAVASSSIELTYGRDEYGSADHPNAVVLTYSDVQKWFKLLRRHGYPCRYFAVGEYGTLKGRAHWHLVVFWLERVPPFAGYNQRGEWGVDWNATRFLHHRVDDDGKPVMLDSGEPAMFWPHGWTFVEPVNYLSVRYKTKYINKGMGDLERQGHLSMSKKPPLGAAYFIRLAERYVEQGLAPRDFEYRFGDVLSKTGKRKTFWLQGKSREIFLSHFIETWERQRPGQPLPSSELLEQFTNKQTARRMDNFGRDIPTEMEKDLRFAQRFEKRLTEIQNAKNAPWIGGSWNLKKYSEGDDGSS